eukprot:2784761-Prymnesium_polylepis.2
MARLIPCAIDHARLWQPPCGCCLARPGWGLHGEGKPLDGCWHAPRVVGTTFFEAAPLSRAGAHPVPVCGRPSLIWHAAIPNKACHRP